MSFADAVRMASEFLDVHPDLLTDGHAEPWRVNVERFIGIIEQERGCKVSIKLATNPTERLHGSVMTGQGKAIILVDAKHAENECWQRMVTVKELMHVLIGKHCNGSALTTELMSAKTCWSLVTDINVDLHCEVYCFCAAVELLIPRKFRGQISDAFHKQNQTHLAIAKSCKVPAAIIRHYFEGFGELSSKVMPLRA
jgi:hypothetical protein